MQIVNFIKTHEQKLTISISVFFILLIINSIFQFITSGRQPPVNHSKQKPDFSSIKPDEKTSLKTVADYHLFGRVTRVAPKKNQVISAPETKKALYLKGIFATDDKSDSLAIISEKDAKAEIVTQGDFLHNGSEVIAIYLDRVVLSSNGKLETLKLKRDKATIHYIRTKTYNKAKSSAKNLTGKLINAIDLYYNDHKKFKQQTHITKTQLAKDKYGYMLSHNDRQLMAEIGLSPRDIITSINNISVEKHSELKKLFSKLETTKSLSVSILRNGIQKELIVELN